MNPFDRIAADYARFRRPYPPKVVSKILSCLNKPLRHCEVLDIGCGTGLLTIPIAEKVKRVVAIDPSEKMLSFARNSARNTNGVCEFSRARAEDLPFRDYSFDSAIMAVSIHHTDEELSLAEAWRVLRKKGTLLILTINTKKGVFHAKLLSEAIRAAEELRKPPFPLISALAPRLKCLDWKGISVWEYPELRRFNRFEYINQLKASSAALLFSKDQDLGAALSELDDILQLTHGNNEFVDIRFWSLVSATKC
jgi:ubiquinone/menaquinone biosynthesis C-methylase UbiE